jgi:hypothetical protein
MDMTLWLSNRREDIPSRFYIAFLVLALAVLPFPTTVWSADQPSTLSAKSRKTVAAGFGFQDAESSSITVKTYDAASGEVLSADTYELDIKDDGPPSSHPRTRIFAGGVGVGSDGLSDFILRVYDASNGKFLWEGRLNLGVGNPQFGATPVMAQVQPRAAMTKITNRTATGGQPYFVLRAVNPQTGQVVWADEFSTEAGGRVEYISRSIIGMTGTAPRDIDFRIMMPDEAGRRLLWEDKVVPLEESEEAVPSDEATDTWPGWSHYPVDALKKQAI